MPETNDDMMEQMPDIIIDPIIEAGEQQDTVEMGPPSSDPDPDPQVEEAVDEDTAKKPDKELIDEYLRLNARCIMCSTPIWSVKLNKAYLDGATYSEMIERFSSKFEERTGRSLNKAGLHRHFNNHFDARAAAIAQYNKSRNLPTSQASGAQRDIFKLAMQKHIDELGMHDTAIKEMIGKYAEIEDIINTKKEQSQGKMPHDLEELLLKQMSILETLAKQSLSKFKALSKVDLENKQGQFLSQLSFLGSRPMLPGSPAPAVKIEANEMEELYLTTVINQFVGRSVEALKLAFSSSPDDQKVFLRELKKSMAGTSEAIKIDFQRRLEHEQEQKQRKLLEKRPSGDTLDL